MALRCSGSDRCHARARVRVDEAIANQRAGRTECRRRTAAVEGDAGAQDAFHALEPGRQREYAAYVADAKRAATVQTRVESIQPMIRAGSGLDDRYRA